jgi:HK97 family phage major capsid protein
MRNRFLGLGPQIIGFLENGEPLWQVQGAAIAVVDDWIPEEWGGAVITRVMRTSVVEGEGRREPMATDTKHVPRSAGVDIHHIGKGGAYGEDANVNDTVLLTARKLGQGIALAEEDIADTAKLINIIETKQIDWANSYAKAFDNACLGVTGAESNTPSDDRPFTSVYKSIRTTQSGLTYTADANYVGRNFAVAGSGSGDYDALNNVFSKYEDGDYFDEGETLVIASPYFRKILRGVKDDEGRPVFVRGQGGDAGTPDTLFGVTVRWSQGCRTSAAMSPRPEGNPLLIVGNRRFLIVGDRSGPESVPIPSSISKEDEAFLKMRARRGFAVGHPKAFAVTEETVVA